MIKQFQLWKDGQQLPGDINFWLGSEMHIDLKVQENHPYTRQILFAGDRRIGYDLFVQSGTKGVSFP